MQFDIRKLSDSNLSAGSIKVQKNQKLKSSLALAVQKLTNNKTKAQLAKELRVHYTTFWDYMNKRSQIPLHIIVELQRKSDIKLLHLTHQFTCGHAKQLVTIPNKMSTELASLIGAIIADGHLRVRKSSRGHHYELIIREEYGCAINYCGVWIKKLFRIEPSIKREKNHYCLYLSNKVIILFLTSVIGLPSGKKVNNVNIPNTIMNNSPSIKQAALKGIFMFDGAVDYATGYVSLVSRSELLVKQVTRLLTELHIIPGFESVTADKFLRHRVIIRKRKELEKCIILFEPNSNKWYRLQEHLYGLQKQAKDLNTVYQELDKFYPRKRPNSVTFSDIVRVVELSRSLTLQDAATMLNKGSTTTYAYLRKLTEWKILKTSRRGLSKVWMLNDRLFIPRRNPNGRKNVRARCAHHEIT